MLFRSSGRGYGYGRGTNQKIGMPTYPVENKKNQVSSDAFTQNLITFWSLNILLHAYFINIFRL